jgi:hypothetical protein
MKKDDFYSQLDSSRYRNDKGCYGLVVFFLLFIIVGSFLCIKLITTLRANFNPHFRSGLKTASEINFKNLSTNLNGFLSGDDKAGQDVSLTLTDEDLTQIINQTNDSDDNGVLASDTKATISPLDVKITGILKKPITTHFNLVALPEVKDGKLTLKIISLKFAGLPVPAFLQGQVSSIIDKTLLKQLNSKNIHYESIELLSHKLVLTGHYI